jgi:hypothetical protein
VSSCHWSTPLRLGGPASTDPVGQNAITRREATLVLDREGCQCPRDCHFDPVWILALFRFLSFAFEIDSLPVPPTGITNGGIVLGLPATFPVTAFHSSPVRRLT